MSDFDWTGITELHARSQDDTKKDGSYVFPRKFIVGNGPNPISVMARSADEAKQILADRIAGRS